MKHPNIPSRDGLLEYLQGIRQTEYQKKEMLTWDQTPVYVKQKVAVLGAHDLNSFKEKNWKPPSRKSKARPPYSATCWVLVNLGIFEAH